MNHFFGTEKFKPPWFIAHRGYRARYPENTLVAFQAALDAGVQMIELDVALSRDRKLVVIHDATLERTTNGQGAVREHTLAQLKQLDAGRWFHPRFAGEHLPELSEVLDLADGQVLINIEIKPHAYEPHHPVDAVERQTIELVCCRNIEERVLISSFDLNLLKHITTLEHAPALGLISRNPADRQTLENCKQLNAVSWHPNHQILTPDQVKTMHAHDIRVFPYNADTSEEIARVLEMDVDGVISSDPLLPN
ncbi:MAG: glycerophosphodiester phosphodiesterase family protein [Desulfobacterales bacterium]|jgi:glycerophosphoryl diester phosphodiesterase